MVSIKTRVTQILHEYEATRDSRSALYSVWMALYPDEGRSLPTVDREARYIQNVLGHFKASEAVQKQRAKHARKMSDKYRSSIETSIVKHENRVMNRKYAYA
jgi:hypothetical protein